MRLFHISDLHFGLEDRRALAWFAECVRVECPAAVMITGDLTMRARSHEFAAACAWIEALDAPVTVEVGNHDLPYFNPFARFFRPYARIRGIERLVERELDLAGLAVVPLKTTARAQWRLDWSKGWVTQSALARTLAAIDALPAGTVTLVTAHRWRAGGRRYQRDATPAGAATGSRPHDAIDSWDDLTHGADPTAR